MKFINKKLSVVIILVLIMLSVLFVTAYNFSMNNKQSFKQDGYVISSSKKIYFNENTNFKNSVDDTITFKSNKNVKTKVSNNSFMHYENKSIGVFKDSYLLDLDNINNSLINYYKLSSKDVVIYKNNYYSLEKYDAEFKSYLISSNSDKFIVVGEDISLSISDKTNSSNGFYEVSYEDDKVFISNLNESYEVDPSSATIYIGKDLIIDLVNKQICYYKDNAKSCLYNIDDIDKLKEENGNTNNSIITDNSNNNLTYSASGIENLSEPKISVVDLLSDYSSVKTNFEITDPNKLITEASLIITDVQSGKEIDKQKISLDSATFNYENIDLMPATEYLITIEGKYKYNNKDYSKIFVQKNFYTESLNITLDKDYSSVDELIYKINTKDSVVSSFDVFFTDSNGNIVPNVEAYLSDINHNNEEKINMVNGYFNIDSSIFTGDKYLKFLGLDSNSEYSLVLDNFKIDNKIYSNKYKIKLTTNTLKMSPSIKENSKIDINHKNNNVTVNLVSDNNTNEIEDIDEGINSYTYELYEISEDNIESEVKTFTTNTLSKIDVTKFLNDGYEYKVKLFANFNDNEKDVEYEIKESPIFDKTGSKLNIEVKEVDKFYEHVNVEIIITDSNGNPVTDNNSNYNFYITDSNKTIAEIPITLDSNGKSTINISKLKSATEYNIELHGITSENNKSVDNILGEFSIQTTEIPAIKLEWLKDDSKNISIPYKIIAYTDGDKDATILINEYLTKANIVLMNLNTNQIVYESADGVLDSLKQGSVLNLERLFNINSSTDKPTDLYSSLDPGMYKLYLELQDENETEIPISDNEYIFAKAEAGKVSVTQIIENNILVGYKVAVTPQNLDGKHIIKIYDSSIEKGNCNSVIDEDETEVVTCDGESIYETNDLGTGSQSIDFRFDELKDKGFVRGNGYSFAFQDGEKVSFSEIFYPERLSPTIKLEPISGNSTSMTYSVSITDDDSSFEGMYYKFEDGTDHKVEINDNKFNITKDGTSNKFKIYYKANVSTLYENAKTQTLLNDYLDESSEVSFDYDMSDGAGGIQILLKNGVNTNKIAAYKFTINKYTSEEITNINDCYYDTKNYYGCIFVPYSKLELNKLDRKVEDEDSSTEEDSEYTFEDEVNNIEICDICETIDAQEICSVCNEKTNTSSVIVYYDNLEIGVDEDGYFVYQEQNSSKYLDITKKEDETYGITRKTSALGSMRNELIKDVKASSGGLKLNDVYVKPKKVTTYTKENKFNFYNSDKHNSSIIKNIKVDRHLLSGDFEFELDNYNFDNSTISLALFEKSVSCDDLDTCLKEEHTTIDCSKKDNKYSCSTSLNLTPDKTYYYVIYGETSKGKTWFYDYKNSSQTIYTFDTLNYKEAIDFKYELTHVSGTGQNAVRKLNFIIDIKDEKLNKNKIKFNICSKEVFDNSSYCITTDKGNEITNNRYPSANTEVVETSTGLSIVQEVGADEFVFSTEYDIKLDDTSSSNIIYYEDTITIDALNDVEFSYVATPGGKNYVPYLEIRSSYLDSSNILEQDENGNKFEMILSECSSVDDDRCSTVVTQDKYISDYSTIKLNNLKDNTKYKIQYNYQVYNPTGKLPELNTISDETYIYIEDLNNVISIGRVSSELDDNYNNTNKKALLFSYYNSNLLNKVDQIVYTLYAPDGKIISYTDDDPSFSQYATCNNGKCSPSYYQNILDLSTLDLTSGEYNIEVSYRVDGKEVDRYSDTFKHESTIYIYKVEDLLKLANQVNNGDSRSGYNYILAASIDFMDDDSYYDPDDTSYGDINGIEGVQSLKDELTTGQGWNPIGIYEVTNDSKVTANLPFEGTFEGNNYTISNLRVYRKYSDYANEKNVNYKATGLFGYIKDSTINNLNIKNSDIEGYKRTGSLVGYSLNSIIKDIKVTGNVNAESQVGLIIGSSAISKLSNSYSAGEVSGDSYVGGITGNFNSATGYSSADSMIYKCYSTASVKGNKNTGGIAGYSTYTQFSNNRYSGNITSNKSTATNKSNVGGIVGFGEALNTFRHNYSSGQLDCSSTTSCGGIAGRLLSSISYSASDMTININNEDLTTKNIGGLVGSFNNYLISNVDHLTNLSKGLRVMSFSYYTGTINVNDYSNKNNYIDGLGLLVGLNGSTDVINTDYVENVTMKNCYSTGMINGNIKYSTGTGLVGINIFSIEKLLNAGTLNRVQYGKIGYIIGSSGECLFDSSTGKVDCSTEGLPQNNIVKTSDDDMDSLKLYYYQQKYAMRNSYGTEISSDTIASYTTNKGWFYNTFDKGNTSYMIYSIDYYPVISFKGYNGQKFTTTLTYISD